MRLNFTTPLTDSKNQPILQVYETVPEAERSSFTEHHHTEIELCYVRYGYGRFKILDRHYDIKPGRLFIFPSNQVHWIEKIDENAPPHFLDIKFEPRLIWSPELNLFEEHIPGFLFDGEESCLDETDRTVSSISGYMEEISKESLSSLPGNRIIIKSDLYRILVILLRRKGTERTHIPQKSVRNLNNLENVMQFINENLSKQLTLAELAKISGYSRTYFSSVFKEFNGISPWEYINIKRVEKAKLLLRRTDNTILYIAAECGFDNLSNFNRLFRKITAKTPSEYRDN